MNVGDISSVQSVERAFAIVEFLSDYPNGKSLAEISRHTQLHKSTAHRLLSSLISMNYIIQDIDTKHYKLTLKLFSFTAKQLGKLDIMAVAKSHLDELSKLVGETIHLVLPSDTEVLYIYQTWSNTVTPSFVMSAHVGTKLPMYRTAVGKSMLAYMRPAEIQEIWTSSNIVKVTPKTITDYDMLLSQLTQCRMEGYTIDDEENELGIRCIGMAILDYYNRPSAAFSISAPVPRMTESRLNELQNEMKRTVQSIRMEISGI
jgi:Transcriptional regulator